VSEASRITLDAMITEVRKELNYRRNVFPNSVKRGTMNARDAAFRFDCMEAVLSLLIAERAKSLGPTPAQENLPLGSGHNVRGE